MAQLLILIGINLILGLNLNANSHALGEVQQVESTEKMDLLKLSKQEFLLTCSILAAGIFILVCIFGIIICIMDMNEVKEAKLKATPSNLFKMSTLKSGMRVTDDPPPKPRTDEADERYQ